MSSSTPTSSASIIMTVKDQRGMALLLAISLISVLTIVTMQFGLLMRHHYIVSASMGNNMRLSEMGRSGTTITKSLLVKDLEENKFDSSYDSWAKLSKDDLAGLFEYGNISVTVTDESGKFPINGMVALKKKNGPKPADEKELAAIIQHEKDVRNILWRLMRAEPFRIEDGVAREIIDSLIDWIDSGDGDGEEEYGAEDSYYKNLDPPYPCKNGPVESIEELLLVKGITPEILYGTEEKPPLAPLLTTWGDDGKINLNTADKLLLQAMAFDLSKETAQNMASYRDEEDNKDSLASPTWYKTVPSFPGDVEIPLSTITSISRFFSIDTTAEINDSTRDFTAIVERKDKEISILSWHAD